MIKRFLAWIHSLFTRKQTISKGFVYDGVEMQITSGTADITTIKGIKIVGFKRSGGARRNARRRKYAARRRRRLARKAAR